MIRLRNPRGTRHGTRQARRVIAAVALVVVSMATLAGPASLASANDKAAVLTAVGAENEYANVLSQIGGRFVVVSSVLNNPNTDPHTFEASTSVAEEMSRALLVVQNGAGYDGFMNRIEAASPNSKRKVIVAQKVLGLPASTPNPHLWYAPKTMSEVAKAMAKDLGELDPAERSYFQSRLRSFDTSLQSWTKAIATFKSRYSGTRVAVTEPVADYLLKAMGMRILTPIGFQADIMNGVDPAPEDITLEDGFLTKHDARVFCYNQQVVDSLTASIKHTALSAKVPVVGVYETMPTPGYDYQSWMLAEVKAIAAAVSHHRSTQKL